jgi:site-specific DNA recombinase
VISTRYPTDLQREASIEDQLRICRQLVNREGWTPSMVTGTLPAPSASRLRPGYQRLLEDARAGAFDVVVAEALA